MYLVDSYGIAQFQFMLAFLHVEYSCCFFNGQTFFHLKTHKTLKLIQG